MRGNKNTQQLICFAIAGTLVTATDFAVYYFFLNFVAFDWAKAISFTCGGTVGYVLNKYWTFKNNQPSFVEIIRYTLVNLLTLVVNIFTNRWILHCFPEEFLIAVVIATILTGLFSFVCFKWYVFTPAKKS